MGTIIAIIIGLVVLSVLFQLLKKIFPLAIGVALLGAVGFGLYSLPWGSIGNVVLQIVYSVVVCIVLVFLGAVFSAIFKQLKMRWVIIPALLLVISIQAKANPAIDSPKLLMLALILSIVAYVWSILKFRFIKKNIGFIEKAESNVVSYYSGMFLALGCISLYLFNFPNNVLGTNYITGIYIYVLVYIGLAVAVISLHTLVKIYEEVEAYICANGFCTVESAVENISTEHEEKNAIAKQILLRMKQNKMITEVGNKAPIFIKTPIYDEIFTRIKNGRSSIETALAVSKNFNIELNEKVVDLVLNNSFVGRRVQRDNINAEFVILRYDFQDHPILKAGRSYQVLYYKLLQYMLQDLQVSVSSIAAVLDRLAEVLNIKEDELELDSTTIKKGLAKICSNEIQFNWFRFSVKNYRLLLLLESVYFRSIAENRIDYDLLEKYCQQLNVIKKTKQEVLSIVETFLLPHDDMEIAVQKCTDKNLIFAGSFLQENLKKNSMYESLPRYNVAVCATMSSGKSTFINALLGNDYIPSRNEACTAKITSIADNDHLNSILGGVVQKDGQAVFQPNISRSTLEEWNSNNNVERVLLEGDLKEIKSEKGVLVIHDTPGTNYSQDQEHHDQTMRFLKNNEINLIIYLVNAEHASTTDNRILLQQIKEEVIRQQSADIIFLVNKLDSYDIEKQDDIAACLNGVKKELVDLGYENPVVLPIVANAARLFKMVLTGQELTKKEFSEFNNLYELFVEDGFDLFEFSKREISIEPTAIEETDEIIKIKDTSYSKKSILEALQMTGITVVESLLDREINFGRVS